MDKEKQKAWLEFRQSGLFVFVNQFLHIFGWAIVVDLGDDMQVVSAYPQRVKYRGFEVEINDEAYKRVSEYMKNNANDLVEDTK